MQKELALALGIAKNYAIITTQLHAFPIRA